MKTCPSCSQPLGEDVVFCPACGRDAGVARRTAGEYCLLQLLRDGYASVLYRARKEGAEHDVMLRLFKPEAGVDEEKAQRLRDELDPLAGPLGERLVRHFEIARTPQGEWYRVSEWVDAIAWGDLIASHFFRDPKTEKKVLELFARIASAIHELHLCHRIIPHLTLDDILVYKDSCGELAVKIDYKLSRAIDPDLAHASLMLRKLLDAHPDFTAGRPLDARSDVWSLGKIMVELLAGDDDLADHRAAVEKLPVHRKLKALLRQMVEDDPALRPASMATIAALLGEVTERDLAKARHDYSEIRKAPNRQGRRLARLAIGTLLAFLAFAGAALWLQTRHQLFYKNDEQKLAAIGNQYAQSVALVVVHYWLAVNGEKKYAVISEGTAFLVHGAGYLLTNRHVACPWLADQAYQKALLELSKGGTVPECGYTLALWFDGQKALKRASEDLGELRFADRYYLDTAFRSDGAPGVGIAGVLIPPESRSQLMKSPLGDDVALLKIDHVPPGLAPLPLEAGALEQTAARLAPVMAMGFPRGSAANRDPVVRVGVTLGHVRRCFGNEIQADVSLHPGNSGGPVIGVDGRVLGIASAVFSAPTTSSENLQSDFSLILPIRRARELITEVQAGKLKWDGVLDPATERTIANVFELAKGGEWAKAQSRIDEAMAKARDARTFIVGGLVHFARGDRSGAAGCFAKATSINANDDFPKMLAFVCGWADDPAGSLAKSSLRQELLALDWRSPCEFYGYLVRVLEGQVDQDQALRAGETSMESALLRCVLALRRARRGQDEEAETLLKESLRLIDKNNFCCLLIRAALERTQERRARAMVDQAARVRYPAETKAYWAGVALQNDASSVQINQALVKLADVMQGGGANAKVEDRAAKAQAKLKEEIKAYQELMRLDPLNRPYSVAQVYVEAMVGAWSEGIFPGDEYLRACGRENANSLGVGLLRAELLNAAGRREESRAALRHFAAQAAPWYRDLAKCLLGEIPVNAMQARAGERPEDLVTLECALGLWAEGEGQPEKAIDHYSLALESQMNTWMEYRLAKERIIQLRRPKPTGP